MILNSNSGDKSISINCVEVQDWAAGIVLECELELKMDYFDGDHDQEMHFSASGVFLCKRKMKELGEVIDSWVRQDLENLKKNPLSHKIRLSPEGKAKIELEFGPRADTISGLNPVVALRYVIGSCYGEFSFVTDQSCLVAFMGDIDAALT